MLMRRNLPIANQLNNLIRQSVETGLLQKWTSDSQSQLVVDRSESFEISALTIDHMAGAWFCIVLGGVIGTILVVLERWLHSYVNAKGTRKSWIILQFELLVIRPERHAFNWSWAPTMIPMENSEERLYPYLE